VEVAFYFETSEFGAVAKEVALAAAIAEEV